MWGYDGMAGTKAAFAVDTISSAARLYVIFLSVAGSLLLDLLGPRLLALSAAWARTHTHAKATQCIRLR